MRTRIEKSAPRICDTGTNRVLYRIMANVAVYLTPDELADYYAAGMEFEIVIPKKESK